jgi:hypothetical protein
LSIDRPLPGESGDSDDGEAAVGGTGNGRDGSTFTRVRSRPVLSAVLAAGFLAMLPVAGAAQGPPAANKEPSAEAGAQWCSVSGEQILAGNAVRAAVYQEQFSRYSPRANRCFVEMRVLTIAADEHADRAGRFLYDGETKELLAFAEIRNGKKSGRVFDLNHRTRSFKNGGWDDASEYIYLMMAGDW